jgi:hypothetical protein
MFSLRMAGASAEGRRKVKRPWSGSISRVLSRHAQLARRVTAIYLGNRLPDTSCGRPGSLGGPDKSAVPSRELSPCLALLRVGFAEPAGSPRPLVRSYRTVSPLPVPRQAMPEGAIGGLFSAALSLTSRSVGVTDHPCPMEPGLSSRREPKLTTGGHPIHSRASFLR